MTREKGKLSFVISALLTLVLLGFSPAIAGATELVPPTDGPAGTTTVPNHGTPIYGQQGKPDPKPPTGEVSPEPNITPEQTQTEVHNYQSQGSTYVLQMRDKLKTEHTQNQAQAIANRQKHCAKLQNKVNKQIANFSSNAQSHLSVFNSVYSKVQTYATDKKVTSTEYQSLVTTANTQQASATQAVDALKSVAVTVNCSQPDPASSLATVKSAVDSTRTALQAYQQAIKAVISNLESVAGKQQQ
jgi:hypothetical protein